MSAKKNSHCRGGTSYYILFKEFFFEIICMNGCSMSNNTICIKKVNRVIFDFILTLMFKVDSQAIHISNSCSRL